MATYTTNTTLASTIANYYRFRDITTTGITIGNNATTVDSPDGLIVEATAIANVPGGNLDLQNNTVHIRGTFDGSTASTDRFRGGTLNFTNSRVLLTDDYRWVFPGFTVASGSSGAIYIFRNATFDAPNIVNSDGWILQCANADPTGAHDLSGLTIGSNIVPQMSPSMLLNNIAFGNGTGASGSPLTGTNFMRFEASNSLDYSALNYYGMFNCDVTNWGDNTQNSHINLARNNGLNASLEGTPVYIIDLTTDPNRTSFQMANNYVSSGTASDLDLNLGISWNPLFNITDDLTTDIGSKIKVNVGNRPFVVGQATTDITATLTTRQPNTTRNYITGTDFANGGFIITAEATLPVNTIGNVGVGTQFDPITVEAFSYEYNAYTNSNNQAMNLTTVQADSLDGLRAVGDKTQYSFPKDEYLFQDGTGALVQATDANGADVSSGGSGNERTTRAQLKKYGYFTYASGGNFNRFFPLKFGNDRINNFGTWNLNYVLGTSTDTPSWDSLNVSVRTLSTHDLDEYEVLADSITLHSGTAFSNGTFTVTGTSEFIDLNQTTISNLTIKNGTGAAGFVVSDVNLDNFTNITIDTQDQNMEINLVAGATTFDLDDEVTILGTGNVTINANVTTTIVTDSPNVVAGLNTTVVPINHITTYQIPSSVRHGKYAVWNRTQSTFEVLPTDVTANTFSYAKQRNLYNGTDQLVFIHRPRNTINEGYYTLVYEIPLGDPTFTSSELIPAANRYDASLWDNVLDGPALTDSGDTYTAEIDFTTGDSQISMQYGFSTTGTGEGYADAVNGNVRTMYYSLLALDSFEYVRGMAELNLTVDPFMPGYVLLLDIDGDNANIESIDGNQVILTSVINTGTGNFNPNVITLDNSATAPEILIIPNPQGLTTSQAVNSLSGFLDGTRNALGYLVSDGNENTPATTGSKLTGIKPKINNYNKNTNYRDIL